MENDFESMKDEEFDIDAMKAYMRAPISKKLQALEEFRDFAWVNMSPEKRKIALKLKELGF